MASKTKDIWANLATIHGYESAVNTFQKVKLETAISVFDKKAWLINRLELTINNIAQGQLLTEASHILFALLADGSVTSLNGSAIWEDARVVQLFRVDRSDHGAAPASGEYVVWPRIYDYSSLPGGGLLVPPTQIYFATQGVGCNAVNSAYLKIFYTILDLTTDEYWELVEARRMITA